MTYTKQSYVEHVAIRVRQIDWHIRFFQEVLGLTVSAVQGAPDAPAQVWTIGGLQLVADPDFNGPEGRLAHLGIMTEDLEAALLEAHKWGVTPLPQGRNWLALPDALVLELIQAHRDSVAKALRIKPRA